MADEQTREPEAPAGPEQQPGYAERDDAETTPQTGGEAGEEPQGGEHFGEAPLGGDAGAPDAPPD